QVSGAQSVMMADSSARSPRWLRDSTSRTIDDMIGARALSRLDAGARVAGRYQVLAHVGSGGMGDVYEVEHTLLGRRFALKRLAPGPGGGAALVAGLLRAAGR